MKNIFIGAAIVLITVFSLHFTKGNDNEDVALQGLNTTDCAVSTVTPATVGDDISSTLLASAANRAWAIIQQPLNATNTVSISFDEGAAAVLGLGISLQNSSTTTGTSYLKFGLSTDFPYAGAVTGITSTGSSTVQITQCLYN